MKGTRVVIKFGGSALEVPEAAATFASDLVKVQSTGYQAIVVHGGGKSLSNLMTKVGLEPRFVEGLRYTDAATLELAQMVLAGKANKDLVALINLAGGTAVGLSGTDGHTFTPQQIRSPQGADLGFVGEIANVNPALLLELLKSSFIPVVCSVGHDKNGQGLNVNADHVAAELARELQVQDLILLTDVDGIKIEGKLLQRISFKEGQALITHKDVSGGMRPKIEYAVRALLGGVKRAHIVNAGNRGIVGKILAGEASSGTTIEAAV
ncbi:MAG: acetylglutamate kinase [Deltaproteobacteria bacterium]|nr:acetylglutamate kinase [Deltaproteobacteria bacterium]